MINNIKPHIRGVYCLWDNEYIWAHHEKIPTAIKPYSFGIWARNCRV
jgi:hypothetical protein